jgi:hypothetical protein
LACRRCRRCHPVRSPHVSAFLCLVEHGGKRGLQRLRGGVAVGTTFWDIFTPYVVGRAFGGPIHWRYQTQAIIGTDDHHWQVGAGFSIRVARRVDLFAEGVPLGELGVTAGAGVSF